jgi:hypothetical protein
MKVDNTCQIENAISSEAAERRTPRYLSQPIQGRDGRNGAPGTGSPPVTPGLPS